jgi:hypothetical protein
MYFKEIFLRKTLLFLCVSWLQMTGVLAATPIELLKEYATASGQQARPEAQQ